MRRSSTSSSRPSSCTGSKRRVLHSPDDQRRHLHLGKARSSQVGQRHSHPGRRHDQLAAAIPVQHRGQSRPAATIRRCTAASPPRGSATDRHGWRRSSRRRHRSPSSRPPSRRRACGSSDVLRSGALVRVLDQALLEDQRVRRVDDRQLRRAADRRAAPPATRSRRPSRGRRTRSFRAPARQRARKYRRSACRSRSRRRPAAGRSLRSRAGPA